MASSRNQLIQFIEHDSIPEDRIDEALSAAKIMPDKHSWYGFVDQFLLWLGSLALAFSALFFIAFNWDALGRFAKFGMVEGLMLLSIVAYWQSGRHEIVGKVSLLIATLLLGVLLALYGQTYQTGADPWQLFFNWALLMLPWAAISRFPVIWIIWTVLINLSIVLYHKSFRSIFGVMVNSGTEVLWTLFFFNTIVLSVWEYLARSVSWLSERWAMRTLATGGGIAITWIMLSVILGSGKNTLVSWLVWSVWLLCLYLFYRRRKPDLFMLAGACLTGIIVTIAFLSKHLLRDWDAGGLLLLALIIVGLGSWAAIWLKSIHKEYSHESG